MSDASENAVDDDETPVEDIAPSEGDERATPTWKKVAVAVGGVAATAAAAAVVTLAATHKSAVFENAKAYANGMNDALDAVRNGYDPFEDEWS